MKKSAIISNSGLYRYELHREWDKDKGKVLFIMLNPSTACGVSDDLTTRRCINFAKKWGFGGIMIGNIYPFRAKRPKDLRKWINTDKDAAFETTVINQAYVGNMSTCTNLIVCAWGCNYKGGIPEWVDELGDLHYLELCDDGITPKHPLGNLSKDLVPIKYKLNTTEVG